VFYTSFANAVRGRGTVPVDPWDAVAGLKVLEAAQRSAATGQVVALGPGAAMP
jgi:predicted dehydrogenase